MNEEEVFSCVRTLQRIMAKAWR